MMSKVSRCNVVEYSERGMVNELVYLIRSNGDPVGLTRQLLNNCFKWQNDEVEKQVARIAEKMTDVTFIVEPSFAQFGDPDLIIIPKVGDSKLALFFVEAKVISYEHSAKLVKDPMDMKQKGFNSTIIGQLSLRYRLAKALADRWINNVGGKKSLKESGKVAVAYSRMREVHIGNPRTRSLAKPENLEFLLPLVQLKMESAKAIMERSFYIALTLDDKNPFETKYPLFKNGRALGYDNSDLDSCVPHYYREEGTDPIYCQVAIDRTGWTGWELIRSKFSAIWDMTPSIKDTWKLAFPADREQKQDSHCTSDHIPIRTIAWDESDNDQDALRVSWEGIYLSNRSSDTDDMISYVKGKGSDSGKYSSQTIFKLLNLKDESVIALREDLGIILTSTFNRPICINGVPFRMRPLPAGDEVIEVEEAVSKYIEELRERI
jgi:hypothetical protein